MDRIGKIIEEYQETREDFIFKTIYPYCTEVIERKVNKEELKRILNRGLLYEETVDELSKRANELTEQSRRLTQRNNELRGKVLRLIREKEELTKTLDKPEVLSKAKTLHIVIGNRGNTKRGYYTFLSEQDAQTWAQELHGSVESQFISIDGKIYHVYIVCFGYEELYNEEH